MAVEGRLVAAQRVPARPRAERRARVQQRGVLAYQAQGAGGGGGRSWTAGAQAAEGEEFGTRAGVFGLGAVAGGGVCGLRFWFGFRRKRLLPLLDQGPGALVNGVVDGDDGGNCVGEGVGCVGSGRGGGRGRGRGGSSSGAGEGEGLRVVFPQDGGEELLLRWVDPVPRRMGAGFAFGVGGPFAAAAGGCGCGQGARDGGDDSLVREGRGGAWFLVRCCCCCCC